MHHDGQGPSFTTQAHAAFKKGAGRRLLGAAVVAVIGLVLLAVLGPDQEEIKRRFEYYGAPGELRIMPEVSIDDGSDAIRQLPKSLQQPPPPAEVVVDEEPEDPDAEEVLPVPREGTVVEDTPREVVLDAEEASESQVEFSLPRQSNPDYFIIHIEPPVYPYPVDHTLARRGREVFGVHCAGCHGSYGEQPRYPNLLVSLEQVGTDRAYAEQAYHDSDRFMDWFNRSWYGQLASASPALGYVAPPLDGVWVTAPFLHNGSVPTLAALLDSSLRPRYWTRSFDAPDYDPQTLGWRYKELEYGKAGAGDAAEAARIYDTTLPGYGNAGHTFADDLAPDERASLLEYLKTL